MSERMYTRADMARAWEEGFDRGFYDPLSGGGRDASETSTVNPYDGAGDE